jgi:hypothetical protein
MDRRLFRVSAFLYVLALAIGSTLPDWSHAWSLITKDKMAWDNTHDFNSVMCWILIALLAGFLAGTLLTRCRNGN